MATGKQIADTALQAIERQGGYIWGQQGAVWTEAKQKSLEKRYNENPSGMKDYAGSVQYGPKWVGHPVWDCAGLCRWAAAQHDVAIHAGSNLIWDCDLKAKGQLANGQRSDGMQLQPCTAVFTGTKDDHPHVGMYVGDGLVIEAAGTAVRTGAVFE